MDYITTTNLRTQSTELVNTLKRGGIVSLIHRSKVVGVIKPKKELKIMTKKDIDQLKDLALNLELPKLSYEERDNKYRENLIIKYGKDLS